jgi:hypothetical protein
MKASATAWPNSSTDCVALAPQTFAATPLGNCARTSAPGHTRFVGSAAATAGGKRGKRAAAACAHSQERRPRAAVPSAYRCSPGPGR